MPEFTRNWFAPHIPKWSDLLRPLKGVAGLSFLEIGTQEGACAYWLMTNILTDPTARLYCIDPFLSADELYQRNRSNLSEFGDRVILFRERSAVALKSAELQSKTFQLIYIDGSHLACDVLQDAVLSFPLLDVGGIMIFDDYMWNPVARETTPALTPKIAIESFLRCYDGHYALIDLGTQVIIQKTLPANIRQVYIKSMEANAASSQISQDVSSYNNK
ncbi:MAG: class I SAM-dependent methyltransferase [Bdellovibrionales bacterium]|nr:class I SAM-dependent methyltransferase [Bdellovibrionales bacterium]